MCVLSVCVCVCVCVCGGGGGGVFLVCLAAGLEKTFRRLVHGLRVTGIVWF